MNSFSSQVSKALSHILRALSETSSRLRRTMIPPVIRWRNRPWVFITRLAALATLAGLALSIWLYVLSPIRGGDSTLEAGELAKYLSTVLIEVSADPSEGAEAPLRNVDLTATLPGVGGRNVTYWFDCTDDGTWEKVITARSTTFTAVDLCDYGEPGVYTARVRAETGNLAFEDTVAISVPLGTLFAQASAEPSSGAAPLNDVDFFLVVASSGTASGDITYKIDCTSDGSWEHEETVTTASSRDVLQAEDACDYPSAGSYHATVRVERGNLSAQGGTAIFVDDGAGGIGFILEDFDNHLRRYGVHKPLEENGGQVDLYIVGNDKAYRGSSLQISFDCSKSDCVSGWAIYFVEPLDLRDSSYLCLRVAGEVGGETYRVGLKSTDGDGDERNTTPRAATQEWKQEVIPLSDFSGVDFRSIGSLGISGEGGEGTIYLDEIIFVDEGKCSQFENVN